MMKFLIFLLPVFLVAQEKITPQSIDAEINKFTSNDELGNSAQFIRDNIRILENSQKISYSRGITVSALNLSARYTVLNDYKKSLEYLKLGEKEQYAKDNQVQVRIKTLYSVNYFGMNLYQEAANSLKEIIPIVNKIKPDSVRLARLSSTFVDIGKVYLDKNQLDSASIYTKKAINTVLQLKDLTPRSQMLLAWSSLALVEIKIKENKIDSAEIYLKSFEARPERLQGNMNFKQYKVTGMLHDRKKEYDLAIADYQKAIEMAKGLNYTVEIEELYKLVSGAYAKRGDKNSAQEYFQKYIIIKDSLESAKQLALEGTVKELITQKEKNIKAKNKFLIYGTWTAILSMVISMPLIITALRRKNKILNVKEQETQLLNQKLNLAFENVIQMAKNNDPEFLARFQEVYPEFFPRLLKVEPQLLNTDLKFCAMLFLNFSTKDIATFTFIQPQSVQTKKNRLRKKLNISSDEDIYVWMKNINDIY
ncbi:tetratricopeptide repeat protein [Chryseobacterium shigense]|uniref:Tetratricopeptide (TPR) repeat protein n=1 Tax=Chryseobacterium shigense TaxID=297244 RepID=A0A841NGE9_9FLAO|nr:hypothetical protein [Chryseobacterium shigense]MBB6370379.1 tetratricopeptide (TPR) repeat protein [Chryseobacterium shigense]